jgi:hypothetical protein
MTPGMIKTKKIECSEVYDQEDDTYYVTFKTGEPSYCIELDDICLLEVGVFTNLPTGLRILNFHRHKLENIKINIRVLLDKVKTVLSDRPQPTFNQRNAVVRDALEKVLA